MMTILLTVVITVLVCYFVYEFLIVSIVANNGIISKKDVIDYKGLLKNLKTNPTIKNVLQDFGGDIDKYTIISNCPSLIFSYFVVTEKGMFGVLRWSKSHKITKEKFNEMYNDSSGDEDNRDILLG